MLKFAGKKRGFVEDDTSHVIVEDVKPKKLKFIIRERTISNHLEQLDTIKDENVLLQILLDIWTFTPLHSHDVEVVFRRLIEHYYRQPLLQIQIKILHTLENIICADWLPPSSDLNRLMKQILDALSKEVIAELLEGLLSISLRLVPLVDLGLYGGRLLVVARRHLGSEFWQIRDLCLRLFASIWIRKLETVDSLQLGSSNEALSDKSIARMRDTGTKRIGMQFDMPVEELLSKYCADSDGRVRATAVQCLLTLQESGFSLSQNLYTNVCGILTDSNEEVRCAGLLLVWKFARQFSECIVMGPSAGVELRLVDDAFARLCEAMHDISVQVRTKAAELLGTLKSVSQKFLEQTLDKKRMSHMRFLKAQANARLRNRYLNEWTTGRKFGEDMPMERAEEDSLSLIPSGACGALISGLEDEYLAVRKASVEAVWQLAVGNVGFAKLSLDFLADMFNDEIHEVRLNAIKALRSICQHITLKEDEVEIILNALDDASADSREAVRDLLSVCILGSRGCLKLTVDALLNDLKRYPMDKLSVWNCARALGSNHPAIVKTLVVDLLKLHPFFDLPEPPLDDPAYMTRLIVVLNAAAFCPPIKSMFLGHTWRHYQFIKDSMPQLVPKLTRGESESISDDFRLSNPQSGEFLVLVQNRLRTLPKLCVADRWLLLELVIKDLDRLSDFEAPGSLHFLQNLLECLMVVEQHGACLTEISSVGKIQMFAAAFYKTVKLELLFQNNEANCRRMTCELRLRILACLLGRHTLLWTTYLNVLEHLKTITKDIDNAEAAFVTALSAASEELGPDNVMVKAPAIAACCSKHPMVLHTISDDVRERRADILMPLADSDATLKFTAGLVAAIELRATLHNFDDLSRLRIRVAYPDGTERFLRPRASAFHEIVPGRFSLQTKVCLAHSVWTEPSTVTLAIVVMIPEDMLIHIDAVPTQKWLQASPSVPFKILPKAKC